MTSRQERRLQRAEEKAQRAENRHARGEISTDAVIKAGDKFAKEFQKTCPHSSKTTENGVTTCDHCTKQV